MKIKSKSASIALLYAGLFLLGACGSGEVPQAVLDQPRPITASAPEQAMNQPWPRLGDVPSKPVNFSPTPVIEQAKSELAYERAEAQKMHYHYDKAPALLTPPILQP